MSDTKVNANGYDQLDESKIVFETFDSLDMGESMEITNSHDPREIFSQMRAERPNQFEWNYLQKGPELWKISIEKKYQSFI